MLVMTAIALPPHDVWMLRRGNRQASVPRAILHDVGGEKGEDVKMHPGIDRPCRDGLVGRGGDCFILGPWGEASSPGPHRVVTRHASRPTLGMGRMYMYEREVQYINEGPYVSSVQHFVSRTFYVILFIFNQNKRYLFLSRVRDRIPWCRSTVHPSHGDERSSRIV